MMNNYEPLSVSGQVFYKLGRQEDGPEGNVFGPWDPKTFEVEDSAFGLVKMKMEQPFIWKPHGHLMY